MQPTLGRESFQTQMIFSAYEPRLRASSSLMPRIRIWPKRFREILRNVCLRFHKLLRVIVSAKATKTPKGFTSSLEHKNIYSLVKTRLCYTTSTVNQVQKQEFILLHLPLGNTPTYSVQLLRCKSRLLRMLQARLISGNWLLSICG